MKEKQHKNGSRSVTHAALTPRWGGELSLIYVFIRTINLLSYCQILNFYSSAEVASNVLLSILKPGVLKPYFVHFF